MPDADLRQLAEVEEISIGVTRPDGSTGSTPVWVAQAGDAIFVRSIRGRRGGWYRRLRANPDGEVGDAAHTHRNVLVGGLDSCTPANMADSGGITRVPVRRRAGLAPRERPEQALKPRG
jgi:Uncharacterized protein conserved in bacteria (DUF2255)